MSETIAGVFNIDKPAGLTSHDVVQSVRKLTGIRKAGHAGTLDPLATGVLLVCIGAATRVIEYLQAGAKVYRTTVRLGERTTTYDAEGDIINAKPVPALSLEQIETALDCYRGEIEQTPPMYSALKYQGRPLHKLARAGIEVERKPRPVTISRLTLCHWRPPDLTLEIVCSPGTYVRTLADDLGLQLGCGAHVPRLEEVGVRYLAALRMRCPWPSWKAQASGGSLMCISSGPRLRCCRRWCCRRRSSGASFWANGRRWRLALSRAIFGSLVPKKIWLALGALAQSPTSLSRTRCSNRGE